MHQNLHATCIRGFLPFIYTWSFSCSRFPREPFTCVRFILYSIFLRSLSVGYYSGGQHLACLWDSAMARQTHPFNLPPKCPWCLVLLGCPGSGIAYVRRRVVAWFHYLMGRTSPGVVGFLCGRSGLCGLILCYCGWFRRRRACGRSRFCLVRNFLWGVGRSRTPWWMGLGFLLDGGFAF